MPVPHPKSHIVPPSTPHTHTIIFLHGRGSNATEFCSEIFESQASDNLFLTQLFPSVKWVFPSASLQHAHLENEDVHQWFDMTSVQNAQDHPEVQRPGLQHGAQYLLSIVEDEAGHVGLQKVILAGISQGCATAIHTLLSSGVCVGGFFGLCGWLPLADEVQQLSRAPGWGREVCAMPVLLQHCRDDGIVPVENGEFLLGKLLELGMRVRWECFEDGGHWLNEPEGVDGIVDFVRMVMDGSSKGFEALRCWDLRHSDTGR